MGRRVTNSTITNSTTPAPAPSSLALPVVAAASHQYLCDVESDNIPNLGRDVGFVGRIGNTTIFSYGDTLDLAPGKFFITSSSSAIGTDNPCFVHDAALGPSGQHPAQFIPILPEYGEAMGNVSLGGSNIIELDQKNGAIFYLKQYRPDQHQNINGTGIAHVTLENGVPVANRTSDFIWSTKMGEPTYGSVTGYNHAGFIYAFGHGGPDFLSAYVTRAKMGHWNNPDAYRYWNSESREWQVDRLYNPTPPMGVQGFCK